MLSEGPLLLRRELLMDFKEFTRWRHHEATCFTTMQDDLAISALEGETDAFCDDKDDWWNDEETKSSKPHDSVNGEVEVCCNNIVTTINESNKHEA